MQKGKDIKPHIGIFGRRNNGKSSFINLLTGQDIAIVSETAGTTTDPVKKSVEIFGIGPVIIIDTAGVDDVGSLGKKRVEKTLGVIKTIDLAVLLISNNEFGKFEIDLIEEFKKYETPFVIFHNKKDLSTASGDLRKRVKSKYSADITDISTSNTGDLELITGLLKNTIPESAFVKPALLDVLIKEKDIVLLVTPIDSEAPEGRMILPQQMAIRDVLDHNAICVTVRETEIEDFLNTGIKPALVITDSQAFGLVSKLIPTEIPLTGFSIVFARMRANFENYLAGTPNISKLKDGDKVLILESCTHHVSCEDIGRYKLPDWIKKFTKKEIEFDIVAGLQDIKNIEKYAMVIQCGGCVVTKKQITNRLKPAIDAGIPVSNYGMAIAFMNGIFDRAIEPFMKINN